MAHKDILKEVMVYNKDDDQIPSGVRRGDTCWVCGGDSAFNVIGQHAGSRPGFGYVQRRVCQRADCMLSAINEIKEEVGL